MPELPEVETIKRGLLPLIGSTVVSVSTDSSLRFIQAEKAKGRSLEDVKRRGKYLIFKFEDLDMMLHLGMTGALTFASPSRFRAQWVFSSTTLTLTDPRGFGRVIATSPGDYSKIKGLSQLGPEPLDDAFDVKLFVDSMSKYGAPIKARLLGQKSMAGPGNYICDEALWRARINPGVRSLTPAKARKLALELINVMEEAIQSGGMSMRNYVQVDGGTGSAQNSLQCYGRVGLPCHRCGAALVKTRVAGRGSTWCPRCQKL